MSLPSKAVDRLFERLAATYLSQWSRQFEAVPVGDAKTTWGHELSGFTHFLGKIAWALENLPERCPNVIEFRNLCRHAPTPDLPRLPEPMADPARVASELAKLGGIVGPLNPKTDYKRWAKRIKARQKAGESLSPLFVQFANEAMRVSN